MAIVAVAFTVMGAAYAAEQIDMWTNICDVAVDCE
jgi:hypothetical protein